MSLERLWRLSVWLLPASCLIPLGYLAVYGVAAARMPASDAWRTIGLLFTLVTGSRLVLVMAAGALAALAAGRGRRQLPLVILAATCALTLSGLNLLVPGSAFQMFFVVPASSPRDSRSSGCRFCDEDRTSCWLRCSLCWPCR